MTKDISSDLQFAQAQLNHIQMRLMNAACKGEMSPHVAAEIKELSKDMVEHIDRAAEGT